MKIVKKTMIILASLVGLILLLYAEENVRGWLLWELHLRQCIKRGDQLDFNALIPPRIPDAQNMAAAPIFAELLKMDTVGDARNGMLRLPDISEGWGRWMIGKREDMRAWQAAFSNDDLNAAMTRYDPVFVEIEKANRRPLTRFEQDYTNLNFRSHSMLLKVGKLYRLKALIDLYQGRTEAAADDIRLMVRLANTMQDEPLLTSTLVRIGILAMTLQPLWEGISAHRWKDNELRVLGDDFKRLDLIQHMDLALRGERCYSHKTLHQFLKTPEKLLFYEIYVNPAISWLVKLTPRGWAYIKMRNVDKVYVDYFLAHTNMTTILGGRLPVESVERICLKNQTHRNSFNISPNLVRNMIGGGWPKAGEVQTLMQCAAVACALERYRLTNKSYPDQLESLTPDYIDRIPLDVIDGKPLRYQQDGSVGYVLYSVGWNRRDEAGVSSFESATAEGASARPDKKQGDWSWRVKPAP